MKKRFFKWREKRKAHRMRLGDRTVISFLAALCLLFGMAVPVYGTEKQEAAGQTDKNVTAAAKGQTSRVVITDIYHRHIGSPDVYGGCYKLAIEHVHQGSASAGGGCYSKPVYHTHQGSEDAGGGCYGKEIYHEHQGNAVDGGGCFSVPVCHQHQNSCYEERACTVSYTTVNVLGTETGRCFRGHGDTAFVRAEGIASHDSCDKGTVSTVIKYCQQCGFMAPTMHDYQAVICGKDENTVESYQIGCGKEETDVERYEPNCGHEENEIESYEIECDKDVDGYGLDCGLKEDVPCGRLILTNETEGVAEEVTLSVKLEDLTGGRLELESDPFLWRDENGNQAGSGDRIQVKENGDYSVTVRLKNKDVDESGLVSQIPVDNIYKAKPTPTASEAPAPTQSPVIPEHPADSPRPVRTPDTDPDTPSSDSGETIPEDKGEELLSDIQQEPEELKEPEEPEEALEAEGLAGFSAKTKEKAGVQAVRTPGEKADPEPTPSKTPSPKVVKETKKKVLPEKQAMEKIQYEVKQAERKGGFFANSMVRVITVTAGALVLLAGILLWLLYLRNSVKVYNDDGEGRMICLGRCIVRLVEDAYTIKLTEKMVEKAYTNRYCIKPGLFRLGREDEALVVCKEAKNVTVYISKEMIAVL